MSKLAKALTAAAGNAGESLYVEDVFSTYVYAGNSTAGRAIVNGIDLSGEGGLVWIKDRTSTDSNSLFTTDLGANKTLLTDSTVAEDTVGTDVFQAFNSNGFTVGSHGRTNLNNKDYASWTFRKAEKFFDVVTYTGNGTAGRTVAHNLGSVPGMIVVKKRSGSSQWPVYHGSRGIGKELFLNKTDAETAYGDLWSGVTSTNFTVSNNNQVNNNGDTYVAYVFASDAGGFGDDGSENIIKCGSFTTGAQGKMSGPVNCGFEPQWLLVKNIAVESWNIYDVMRGLAVTDDRILFANSNEAEATGDKLTVTATGFDTPLYNGPFASSATYIYMAIRRPMKTPAAGTEVFAVDTEGSAGSLPGYRSGFPVDMIIRPETGGGSFPSAARLIQGSQLVTNGTNAETAYSSLSSFYYMNGFSAVAGTASNRIGYMFKRATGFVDVVAYTGTGSATTQAHNLGVVPELMIIKKRDTTRSWIIYSKSIPINQYLTMPAPTAAATFSMFNDTAPTPSVFSIGTDGSVNTSAGTYITYLFATLAGVSKVGSYTGTGNNLNVDCGFSSGARFILIKRTDASGDWYVWDSLRGISAGNDPYLLLNTTDAQVTNTDYIDPLSSGFTVTSSASSTVNVSSGTYIFLAIA